MPVSQERPLGPQQQPHAGRSSGPGRGLLGMRDLVTLLFLTLGSVLLLVLGWLVGVVLLWTSTTWTTREKLIGTLVLPGGFAPLWLLVMGVVGSYSCTSSSWSGPDGVVHSGAEVCARHPSPWLGGLLLAVLVLAPAVTATWLGRNAASRTRLEPPLR